jgi:transposase-like protein
MVAEGLEEIHTFTRAVANGEVSCDCVSCLRCGKRPSSFRLHDRRRRIFLVIVERLVHEVLSLIPRWKCPLCGRTFTTYPAFAVPRKRYVRKEVLRFSERYVNEDRASYRKAATEAGLAVFYRGGEEEKIDERQFAHTTVHRWFPFLGSLKRTAREALRLIREKAPGSGIFRKIVPVPPWKYRSEERRQILIASRRLLQVESEFRALFENSLFPRFATGCRWS